VLAAAGLGALYGLMDRFAEPDLGFGLLFAAGGLVLLVGGVLPTIFKRPEDLGVACGAAAVLAYEVVGPRNWGWMVLVALALTLTLAQSTRED